MKKLFLFFALFVLITGTRAQNNFTLIPLGVYGGSDEGNLSAYLLAPGNDTAFIALDAGTIYDGLRSAKRHHLFKGDISKFLRHNIKGYLISHPHLDHVAGMIINSPEDGRKNIYGLPFCIQTLKNKYFTWSSWANFANEGEQPALKKYHYQYLKPGIESPLAQTGMSVTAYLLSHAVPGKSTAFLVRHDQAYFLYLGDTGDDEIEQSHNLLALWTAVAPLVKSKQLKGISIECSYPDLQPDNKLYGHLKPNLLFQNLALLDSLAGGTAQHSTLVDLPVIIAHIKPAGNNEQVIKEELADQNQLGIKLIFPKKGRKILL